MKLFAATLVAISLFAGAASARPVDSVFTDLGQSAPRSVFDDLNNSAPRSLFDGIGDTAPRSIFDDIQQSAPRAPSSGGSPLDLTGE